MTRTGKTPLSNTIIRGISESFPELHKDLIKFLSNDGDRLAEDVSKNPLKATSEPQGRGLKRFFGRLLGRLRK